MKKITSSIIGLLLVATSGFSQLTFDKKSDTCTLENGVEHKAEITIYNNSTTDYGITWRTISSTLLDNDGSGNHWSMQYCECNNCYTNEFNPLPTSGACADPMLAGTSQKWYLTVDPDGQALTDGEMLIEVTNTVTKTKDTLTYVVLSPNSISEVTNFGKISAFPNPANEELNIKYALSNVSNPEITIYNILGQSLQSVSVTQLNGTTTVNTGNLKDGMYFYVLKANGQRISSSRFNVVH